MTFGHYFTKGANESNKKRLRNIDKRKIKKILYNKNFYVYNKEVAERLSNPQ